MYLSLARAKYNRYKVYIHNLANFDGIFLLRVLVKLGNVNVLMNNGKLISIELKFTPIDSNYSIVLDFRDSYQILLSSLSKLGKSFKVAAVGMLAACLRKTIFPYNFVNKNNFNLKNIKLINKFNKLCTVLSRFFNKPVELDLIKLEAPFFDDNILVKAISILSKKMPVWRIFDYIFRNTKMYSKRTANYNYSYSITRSFLAGIKIKIGGRLMTQRVIPKISSRVSQRGATATGKVTYLDWSRVNLKNKRGAHSITVTMSHVI